jgi:hypothetical protein
MWAFIGLVTALYVHKDKLMRQLLGDVTGENIDGGSEFVSGEHDRSTSHEQTRNPLGNFLLRFFYWALFSMLAITFIGNQPYLGLAIALVSGAILGFICTTPFELKNLHARME